MVQHKQHHKTNHNWNLDDSIIIEYGSTLKVTFMNTELVNDIKPIHNPLQMSTNAGTIKMTLKGDVKIGDAGYELTQMVNIF